MTQAGPLVSIVMNCYNSDEFLKDAIDSIYCQSYQNWEIIFWDNGSSDSSSLIAKSYDEKLKYFHSTKTTPLGEARNMAMKKTSGKYVTFLDCDDLYLPERIEFQVNAMENNSTVLSFGSWMEINAFGEAVKKYKIYSESGNFFEKLLYKYNVNFQTLMIDNDFLKKNKIHFDSELTFSPDFNLVMKIALLNNISSIDNYLAKYRVHSNSMTHKYQKEKYNDFNLTIKKLEDMGASDKYPKFKYLASAMLYRMKYRDQIKSNYYFSAFMSLICFILLRARGALIK